MIDTVNITPVPTKWARTTVIYNKKYHWMVYKPNRDLNMPIPCADCNKIFYGDDGKIVLQLHRILNHVRDITW